MAVQLHAVNINTKQLSQRTERKFYLPQQKVDLAYGLLKHTCCFDSEFPAEQINSLYFDTANLEQHVKSLEGEYQKDKVRIRWYGKEKYLRGMQTAFLELKSRNGFTSTKQRLKLQIPGEDLDLNQLKNGIVPATYITDTLASFGYFSHMPLEPVIKISYWRYRFREIVSGQRVSIDSHIRSTMIMPGLGRGEKELELPCAVIEIKGKTMEIPEMLVNLKILYLDWSRFSKYSSCIDSHSEGIGTMGRLSPSGKMIGL